MTGSWLAASIGLLLVVTACGGGSSTEEEKPIVDQQRIQRAADDLRRQVDEVAGRTGTVQEVRRDTEASCQLSGDITSRRHDYSVAVRTGPDTEARLNEDVLSSLQADGWELTSEPAEAPGYRLQRNGFTLGWAFAGSGERVAVVMGSTPCFPVEKG